MQLDEGARVALALAHDICYAKATVLNGKGKVSWVRREPYVPGRTLPLPIDGEDSRSELVRLSTLLHHGAGLLRLEPDYGYRVHRAFPSPRAVYATELYVATPGMEGISDGLYHFQATQHRLVRAGTSGAWAALGATLGTDLPDDATALVLSTDFARVTPQYGDFAYALCTLEAGHALGNLLHVAQALGYRTSVHYHFHDDALRELTGARDRPESPLAVIVLHGRRGMSRAWHGPTDLGFAPLPDVPGASRITAVERAVARSVTRDAICVSVPGASTDANGAGATGLDADERAVLRTRNSGWGGSGGELNPFPIPLPREVLLQSLQSRPPFLADDLGQARPALGRYAVSIRFDGIPAGAYHYATGTDQLEPLTLGDVRDRLRRAYTYPPDRGNLHALAGAAILTTDYADAVARWGTRGHRIINMVCGATAQVMCLAAGRQGFFARPVRAFRDDALEELLDLTGTGQSATYAVLFGANRHPVIAYDLSL